jgi:hypothetical protein
MSEELNKFVSGHVHSRKRTAMVVSLNIVEASSWLGLIAMRDARMHTKISLGLVLERTSMIRTQCRSITRQANLLGRAREMSTWITEW